MLAGSATRWWAPRRPGDVPRNRRLRPAAGWRPVAPSARAASVLGPLLLAALTLAAYLPALENGFVWDDDQYVTANETLRSLGGLSRIWLTPAAVPQYYPLTFTSFWVEY